MTKTRRTVWVLEQGSYSDYRVVGVFSRQAHADAARRAMGACPYDEPTIAEWPLDPGVQERAQGRQLYRVHMDRAGRTHDVARCDADAWVETERWVSKTGPMIDDRARLAAAHLINEVWATDDQHAVKIVNERRAQHLAQGTWGGARKTA